MPITECRAIRGVAVETFDFNENRPRICEPKCIQKAEKIFYRHPDATRFLPNSGKRSCSTAWGPAGGRDKAKRNLCSAKPFLHPETGVPWKPLAWPIREHQTLRLSVC